MANIKSENNTSFQGAANKKSLVWLASTFVGKKIHSQDLSCCNYLFQVDQFSKGKSHLHLK